MQLSHQAVPAGQVGTMLGVGLGDHVHSPSVFSDLSLPCPGPTQRPAEPGKNGVSPTCSIEGVKEEVAGYCVEICVI